jgi:vacuolar iron transporter family protein
VTRSHRIRHHCPPCGDLVILALAVTGAVSAKLGSAGVGRAVARLVVGAALAMAVTMGIGQLVGAGAG